MADRQTIKERRRKKKQQQRITTILIVVGGALILAAVLMMPTINEALTPVGEFIKPENISFPLAHANTMGDPAAPVKLEIYSDFGCGHCADFAATKELEIIEKYVNTGQVYLVYNSVGSMLGHPNSIVTAEAAYCAGEQNMFWSFQDLVFVNQADLFANINKKLDKILSAYAEYLNMDLEGFNACIDSNRFNAEIQEDQIDAQASGINLTPSFLINGKLFQGNWPTDDFNKAIEAELAILD